MIGELKGIPQRIIDADKTLQPERAWNRFLEWCISAWCLNSPYEQTDAETARKYFGIFTDIAKAQETIVNEQGANDIFGEMYEEFFQSGFTQKSNGQFFTPQSISDLCAKVTINEKSCEFTAINDCACGSGRMLVAVAKISNKHFFFGEDLDVNSVKMCTLNFLMNGMTGIVTHQDSLNMNKYGGFLVNWGLNGEPFGVAGHGVPSILYLPAALCHEVNKRLYRDMYVTFHTGKRQFSNKEEKEVDKKEIEMSPRKDNKVKSKQQTQHIQYSLF